MIDAYSEEFMNRQSPQWWYNKASQLHASAGVVWHFGVANKVSDSIKKELGFPAGFSLDAGCFLAIIIASPILVAEAISDSTYQPLKKGIKGLKERFFLFNKNQEFLKATNNPEDNCTIKNT